MSTESKINFLGQFPIFDCLSADEKYGLAEVMEARKVKRYSFIYLPDESSDSVFLLAKGTVKIGTHSNDGREVIKSLC